MNNLSWKVIAAIGCCVLGFMTPTVTCAQGVFEEGSINMELNEVKMRMEAEQRKLLELKSTESKFEQSLDKLKYELGVSEKKRDAIRSQLDMGNQTVKELEQERHWIQENIDRTKGQLKGRLVAMYKLQRGADVVRYVASARSSHELFRRAYYIESIIKHDQSILEGLRKWSGQLVAEEKKLTDLQNDRSILIDNLENTGRDLGARQGEVTNLLQDIKKARSEKEQQVQKLRQSAGDLERVLASLMGDKTRGGKGAENTLYQGEGLKALKGRLPQPIIGKVLERFGVKKEGEYSDVIMAKGISFVGDVGGMVHAVAGGKVAFSQVIPAYGNVIIIDHGARYYTLYGQVASALVRINDEVKRNDPIAVLGQGGKEQGGRNFYFELRLEGKAIDPWDFFEHEPQTLSSVVDSK